MPIFIMHDVFKENTNLIKIYKVTLCTYAGRNIPLSKKRKLHVPFLTFHCFFFVHFKRTSSHSNRIDSLVCGVLGVKCAENSVTKFLPAWYSSWCLINCAHFYMQKISRRDDDHKCMALIDVKQMAKAWKAESG